MLTTPACQTVSGGTSISYPLLLQPGGQSKMKLSVRFWNVMMVFVLVISLALALPGKVAVQAAPAAELFFSEYIEGSSNNKALEIFNATGAAIDLVAGAYNVQMFFNGNTAAGLTINLTGTVADGEVFVLANSAANATILAQADQTNGAGWFNGDDAVVLRKGTTVIDSIGQIGVDPGTEWGSGLLSTSDNTLRRKGPVTAGDPNATDTFDPALLWDGFASDTFDGLGVHAITPDTSPMVASTTPANGAANVDIGYNLTVTFNEAVNVSGDWFSLDCTISGTHTASVSGGPTTFTLDPSIDFTSETCTLTVLAASVTDQDPYDPPDAMESDYAISFDAVDVCLLSNYTPIPAIQGTGATVAISGAIATRGVVVGDYEGASPALRGFFIQDPAGDGDASTSDGIFVFEFDNANRVSLGDVVYVTGTAIENQGQSQVTSSNVVNCGTGSVDPVEVSFPVPSLTFLEQYEGMLVTLPQTMYVTEHFQLGRFGQVVLSADARLQQPTSVAAPGTDANALQADNNLNKIILDDTLQNQNPDPIVFARGGQPLSASNTLRGGDTATGIVGV